MLYYYLKINMEANQDIEVCQRKDYDIKFQSQETKKAVTQ